MGGFTKNQYIGGNCLKRCWTVCRFKGGGLAQKREVAFLRGGGGLIPQCPLCSGAITHNFRHIKRLCLVLLNTSCFVESLSKYVLMCKFINRTGVTLLKLGSTQHIFLMTLHKYSIICILNKILFILHVRQRAVLKICQVSLRSKSLKYHRTRIYFE